MRLCPPSHDFSCTLSGGVWTIIRAEGKHLLAMALWFFCHADWHCLSSQIADPPRHGCYLTSLCIYVFLDTIVWPGLVLASLCSSNGQPACQGSACCLCSTWQHSIATSSIALLDEHCWPAQSPRRKAMTLESVRDRHIGWHVQHPAPIHPACVCLTRWWQQKLRDTKPSWFFSYTSCIVIVLDHLSCLLW